MTKRFFYAAADQHEASRQVIFKFASKAERDTFVNAPLSVWINSQFDCRYAVNADWRKKAHTDCDGYVYDNDNSEYHCVATIEL